MAGAHRTAWLLRYGALGALDGIAAGTVLPIFGNLMGLIFGVPAGLLLGLVASVTATTDRGAGNDGASRLRPAITVIGVVLAVALTIVSRNGIIEWPAIFFAPIIVHTWVAPAPQRDAFFLGGATGGRRAVLLAAPAIAFVAALLVANAS